MVIQAKEGLPVIEDLRDLPDRLVILVQQVQLVILANEDLRELLDRLVIMVQRVRRVIRVIQVQPDQRVQLDQPVQ